MNSQYDVIIVGAGPAGASCAWNLKRRNTAARVLLIDKAVFPRNKTCGGGISPEVSNYLDFDFNEAISGRVDEFVMEAYGKQTTTRSGEVLMVRREVFDDFLLNKAREQGVETLTGCEVKHVETSSSVARVKTVKGDYSARVVVIAEGGRGKLAKKLGIAPNNKVFAGIEYEHYLEKGEGPLHISFDYHDYGYAWNFPKADGLSLGVGGLMKGKQKDGKGLPEKLKGYVQQFGVNAIDKKHQSGHPIQLYSGRKKLVHGNLMLIGEIAGCVDPLTAEGIRPAIKSGYLAAQVLADALATNHLGQIKKYDALFHSEIGKDFQYARFMAWFLNNYRQVILPRLSSRMAMDCFMSVFGGKSTYREQLSKRRVYKLLSKTGGYVLRRLARRVI